MSHTIQELKMRQALPLEAKIAMTKVRLREWVSYYGLDGVYVSFSGGKDSTVLLHIARSIYPDIKAVFVDTGLEYPEIRDFVKTFDNVDIIRPKMNFKQVIDKYGYPIISKEVSQTVFEAKVSIKNGKLEARQVRKLNGTVNTPNGDHSRYNMEKYKFFLNAPFDICHKCCNITKKAPAKKYEKDTDRKPILATMTDESQLRVSTWLKQGCNAFDVNRPNSKPLSFWTEQDVLKYVLENNIKICSVYGSIVPDYDNSENIDGQIDISELGLIEDNRKLKTTGCSRTGCMFCLFGITQDKSPNRLERMKITHPKQYDYIMRSKDKGGLGYKEVIDWINANSDLNIKY